MLRRVKRGKKCRFSSKEWASLFDSDKPEDNIWDRIESIERVSPTVMLVTVKTPKSLDQKCGGGRRVVRKKLGNH